MDPLRIFLSMPGDVADERALARRLLKEELPYDPFLRGRVVFDVVSWDDPAAPIPMDAGMTPQEAMNRFGPKPSECNIVVVVLWSRLGTHLDLKTFRKPTGEPYLSGTEWEFEDAWNAQPQPDILVYHRTEEPRVGLRDPALTEKLQQYKLVEQFFKRFRNPDGSFQQSFRSYSTPKDFEQLLANDLKHLISERLRAGSPSHSEPKIVISYRRDDAAGTTDRIYDRLADHYGRKSVFMDVDSIAFGVDFHDHIQEQLNGCNALPAIIGPRWLGQRSGEDPRIKDENDWVRIEVETALKRRIPVVPVLVEGATLPQRDQLPETIQTLLRRNAAVVGRGPDFHVHIERLIRSLDSLLPKPPTPTTDRKNLSTVTGQNKKHVASEVDRIRALKRRNVSWRQLRRGSESLTGRDDHASLPARKRALDRSLAKGVANDADLTVEALLSILDEAGLGHEED